MWCMLELQFESIWLIGKLMRWIPRYEHYNINVVYSLVKIEVNFIKIVVFLSGFLRSYNVCDVGASD